MLVNLTSEVVFNLLPVPASGFPISAICLITSLPNEYDNPSVISELPMLKYDPALIWYISHLDKAIFVSAFVSLAEKSVIKLPAMLNLSFNL